jgi:drug/metabolite transporter (DMT)-like permease
MSVLIGLTVVGAGALHAVWNAIAKQLGDRLLTLALIGVPMTAAGGAMVVSSGLPARPAIWFAVASAVVHIAYDVALMNSYRLGALNHVYPIAKGISPLAVTLGAYLFAHEQLAVTPSVGVAVLAVGLISLAFSAGVPTRRELPAVAAAVATGLTIASYSVIDGLGVRHAHDSFAYAGLLFLLLGPVFPLAAATRRPPTRWQQHRVIVSGLSAGVLSVVAYGVVLWAQTRAPLAIVASLRETSVIFAALIGTLFLNERFGARRVAAAAAIAVGIALISA